MPYETGLCGCCEDMQSCLDVFCCQCCQIGRQYKAVEGEVNQLSILHCLCGMCFPSLLTCILRCKVSTRLTLDESSIVSCCLGCLCTSCSLCQMHRQLTLRSCWPGGLCVKQPYTERMQ